MALIEIFDVVSDLMMVDGPTCFFTFFAVPMIYVLSFECEKMLCFLFC